MQAAARRDLSQLGSLGIYTVDSTAGPVGTVLCVQRKLQGRAALSPGRPNKRGNISAFGEKGREMPGGQLGLKDG